MKKTFVTFLLVVLSLVVKGESEDILVQVNGASLTRRDYTNYVNMLTCLHAYRKPKATSAELEKFAQKNRPKIAKAFVRRLILRTMLPPASTNVTDDVRRFVEMRFVKTFGKRKDSFADLRKYVTDRGFCESFETAYDDEVRLENALRVCYSNQVFVSDADIKKAREDVISYNSIAETTNRLTVAKANAIILRARKGEDFAKLSALYSQAEDSVGKGVAEELVESDYESDKSYWLKLKALKDGEVSDLVETESGYEIIKMLARLDSDTSNVGVPSLKVIKLILRKAYVFPEEDAETFRRRISVEKRELFVKKLLADFSERSKIQVAGESVDAK